MLGGNVDDLPLVGTLARKIRAVCAPDGPAPLGRITHKVARVYLNEVSARRTIDVRRVVYTAIQHAAAILILEGTFWQA